MEPPPTTHFFLSLTRTLRRKVKLKREKMDSDVIQILPPPCHKDVQVNHHEVIDSDDDEDYVAKDKDLIDEKIDGNTFNPSKDIWNYHQSSPTENSAARSNKSISIDDDFWSDGDNLSDAETYSPEFMHFDEYASLQAHLDDIHLPAGVEAPLPSFSVGPSAGAPIPWTPVGLNVEAPVPFFPAGPGVEAPQHLFPPVGSSAGAPWFYAGHAMNGSYPLQTGKAQLFADNSALQNIADYKKSSTAGSSTQKKFVGSEPGGISLKFSNKGKHVVPISRRFYFPGHKFTGPSSVHIPRRFLPDPPTVIVHRTPRSADRDDLLSKLQLFKRFDTVEDYLDHHYKGSSAHNAQKNWAKQIQEEWKILENDLPESIYVRAYETRMDLLRAVIVGADGTPYHDGLFFFDIHFPPQYPNVPPLVYYHSGGLCLNPNLYADGKVCLSLLGTWPGDPNESWIPSRSTALQVLVSIQALILNRKPYFNEPGYEGISGTPCGELQSEQYNESTFLLSLKTMTYTLRNPPKHFEDFVLGHFHKYAHVILVACRSYTDGAQVGSLVEGGIRDVNETNKSCSECFKTTLPAHVNILAQEFMQIGVKDCENFCQVAKATTDPSSGSLPKKAAKEEKLDVSLSNIRR